MNAMHVAVLDHRAIYCINCGGKWFGLVWCGVVCSSGCATRHKVCPWCGLRMIPSGNFCKNIESSARANVRVQ